MQYIFILGKNPTLSIAEITSILEGSKIVKLSQEVLILDTSKPIEPNFIKRLGGTIKIGKKIFSSTDLKTKFILDIILKNAAKNKKIYFGFSIHKLDHGLPKKDLNKKSQQIKKIAIEIKKSLKKKNIPSRWVVSKEPTLSSVTVKKINSLAEE